MFPVSAPSAFRAASLLTALACMALLGGCASLQTGQKKKNQLTPAQEQARLEHSFYRSLPGWKKSVHRNKALLATASPENTSIEISIAEQRGLLLVDGAIAMDFPVATGKKTHPTPTGSYTILDKKKDYASNLYGKIYDVAGTVVVQDADSRTDVIPEGGRFEGATMPYWMRLTTSGVGLHIGYVPGRPASHGCVRLRKDVAAEIFDRVKLGTPVTIIQGPSALPAPSPTAPTTP